MPIGGTAFFGMNQHPRITTNYLNQLNRHGDPGSGVNVSTAQVSGSIVQEYHGFDGGKCTFTNPWVAQKADPVVGPLYGGIYMYCRYDPNATAMLARGQLVFWLDELNYIVTDAGQSSATPATPNKIAGVSLNQTLPGYWDFFQITGIALVKLSAAGTLGQPVTFDGTATPPTATPGGTPTIANFLGTIVLTPALANSVSPVEINLLQGYNF